MHIDKIKQWLVDMDMAQRLYRNSSLSISQIALLLRCSHTKANAMIEGNMPKSVEAYWRSTGGQITDEEFRALDEEGSTGQRDVRDRDGGQGDSVDHAQHPASS